MRKIFRILHKRSHAVQAPVNIVPPRAGTLPGLPPSLAIIESNGTWAGYATILFTFKWQRFIEGAWTDIEGSTNNSLLIHAGTGDHRCAVTGTNDLGSATAYTNTIAVIAA